MAHRKKAAKRKTSGSSASDYEEMLKDKTTPLLKKRLIASLVLLDSAHVCVDGAYDVELAAAVLFRRESHRNGTGTAAPYRQRSW